VFVITVGVSLVVNCMTVIYCVVIVLVLGELNGKLLIRAINPDLCARQGNVRTMLCRYV
jgi:hypothetical protein